MEKRHFFALSTETITSVLGVQSFHLRGLMRVSATTDKDDVPTVCVTHCGQSLSDNERTPVFVTSG